MKISSRISIVFSIISSIVIILYGIIIYLLENNHTVTDFSNALKNRVNTTEQFFLEQDSFSKPEFETIKNQFTHKLFEEQEEVIDISQNKNPVFKDEYSSDLKNKLLTNNNYSFFDNKRQGESKIFTIKGKRYLIIVSAFDKTGQQNLSFLLKIIILLTFIAIPLIFIIGFAYSKKALLPIRKKIEKANRISATNLNERLKIINPNDELGQLTVSFNNLLNRLEKSFHIQKSFISNASHEIKNPLTAIMGEAEIALSKKRNVNEYIDSLDVILSESERLNHTVNNLLQLSKVSSNEEHIKYEPHEFSSFIKQTIKSYQFINSKSQIFFKNNAISKINLKALINISLLKTSILNIIDNACKFSDNQPVNIELEIENNHFLLIIKDSGIGVPKNEVETILQPFYRGSNTIKIQGSGIGLALSLRIIRLHKGDLAVNSIEKEGTLVSIKIPILN